MTYNLSWAAQHYIIGCAVIITGVLLGAFVYLTGPLEPSIDWSGATFAIAVALIFPVAAAIASVGVDIAYSDRQAAYKFKTIERPVSLKARFQRNLVLIVYPQIIVLVMAITRVVNHKDASPADFGPVFILISAIMATIGWLYTNYASALKARQTATVEYFTGINSSDHHRNHTKALKAFIAKVSADGSDRLGAHTFSSDEIEDFFQSGMTVPIENRNYSFRELCGYFVSYLEHVALSTRVGIFDFDIVVRQRGRRLMLYHQTLFLLIVRQSGAKKISSPLGGRYTYRRGNDVWENFIWLISWMSRKKKHSGTKVDFRERIDPRRTIPPSELAPVSDSSARYIAEVDEA